MAAGKGIGGELQVQNSIGVALIFFPSEPGADEVPDSLLGQEGRLDGGGDVLHQHSADIRLVIFGVVCLQEGTKEGCSDMRSDCAVRTHRFPTLQQHGPLEAVRIIHIFQDLLRVLKKNLVESVEVVDGDRAIPRITRDGSIEHSQPDLLF